MAKKRTIPSEVLERARKLCALSDDPAASTYEIEQALKVAHDLLVPYGLTVEDVLESLHRDVVEETYRIAGRMRRTKWLDDLMGHVSRFCDTRLLFRTGWVVEYSYVGLASQVQRALFHAQTLHEQVEYYGECRAPRFMRDIRVYKQGVVDRVAETMDELRSYKQQLTPNFVSSVVNSIQAAPKGSRVVVLAEIPSTFDLGWFKQAKVDGKFVPIDRVRNLAPDSTVEVVVDRFRMKNGLEDRISADVRRSFTWGDDFHVEILDTAERNTFTVRKPDPPPRLPAPIQSKLRSLLGGYLDDKMIRSVPALYGSRGAYHTNPDYDIGYQHGAEIKIRAGFRND